MKQRVRHMLQLAVVLALMLSMMPLQGVIAQEKMSDKADIVDTAIAAGDFTTLVELVQAAGLEETLRGEGPFTVFAPTDAAFAAVPAETLDALAADPAALESVLLYHVVPGRLIAALISDGKEVATAQGENVLFSFADGVKKVNGATIVGKDIQAANGVIHVIDSVILPPSISGEAPAADEAAAEGEAAASDEATAEASTVMTDTVSAEATEAMTDTVSAEATEAMTETVATEATEAMTDTVSAEATEAMTETVATEEAAPEASSDETMAAMADIVDTAVAAGSFNTLVAAVQAAGLVDALKGEGPFTVFAPTDDAFAKLPQETIDALLADPTGDLTQILLYHVVAGKVMAADLSDGLEADTLQGKPVAFTLSDGGAMVNDANIIATDIETSNGVIHVIDSVILPPADEAMAEEAMAEEKPAEEATTEAAPAEAAATDGAPEKLPVTGAETNTNLGTLIALLVLAAVGALAFVTRRRTA